MLLVRTVLGQSAIDGIGLFAAEPITKGTRTWAFLPDWDRLFTAAEIATLPEPARSEMLKYVYWNGAADRYVFCLDNARFMNHSEAPNTDGVLPAGDPFGYDVALRNIEAGEELTCDYRAFDGAFAHKLAPVGSDR